MSAHRVLFAVLTIAIAPAVLFAQRGDAKKAEIPAAYRPPAGLCRIWVDGVPADKQPAPTDCATALRNKPGNGQVVFGESKSSAPASSRSVAPLNVAPLRSGFAPPARGRTARDTVTQHKDTSSPQKKDSSKKPDSTQKKPGRGG